MPRRSARSSELTREGPCPPYATRGGGSLDSKQESRKQLLNDALDMAVLAAVALLAMALVTLL